MPTVHESHISRLALSPERHFPLDIMNVSDGGAWNPGGQSLNAIPTMNLCLHVLHLAVCETGANRLFCKVKQAGHSQVITPDIRHFNIPGSYTNHQ